MTFLQTLSTAIHAVTYDSLPEEVKQKAKLCLLDYFGVLCSAFASEEAQRLAEACRSGEPVCAEDLAFLLGCCSRIPDLDDGHRFAMAHPGVVIHSAVAASVYCAPEPVPGERIICAIVRGYEVYCQLGRLINPSSYKERGFDTTSVCGAPAAAAAVAAICSLSEKQTENAIAIAISLTGGLNQYVDDGTDPKYLCAGWGAKLGIAAANLAKKGFTGPKKIIEGKFGLVRAFSLADPPQEFVGINWEILTVYLKQYACVRRMHAVLDGAATLMRENDIHPDQIDGIEIHSHQFLLQIMTYEPRSVVKAQTCLPYCMAILLLHKQISEQLLRDNLDNEAVRLLAAKVTGTEEEHLKRMAKINPSLWGLSDIVFRLKDGRSLSIHTDLAQGDPEKPFSKDQINKKYLALSGPVIGADLASALWDRFELIDGQDDARLPVISLLSSCLAHHEDS